MRPVRSKIMLLILAGIIVSVTMIGGIGIVSFRQAINEDSVKIVNLTCDEKANEFKYILGRIQQPVEIMAVYTVDNLESTGRLSDGEYMEQYTQYV